MLSQNHPFRCTANDALDVRSAFSLKFSQYFFVVNLKLTTDSTQLQMQNFFELFFLWKREFDRFVEPSPDGGIEDFFMIRSCEYQAATFV
ncbi:hypothetical protein SAMN05216279_1278 [Pseudomonas oryzihabitans]|uniref:Uncharacterized protein n=1 Tax=Pseudomonas oryzihabitans TaxID=47885 RepID=A0A1G5PGR0_9PSED|nr:hypothetical protein SAMN05216279_1278 [Pseudomonas psychrotolerans]